MNSFIGFYDTTSSIIQEHGGSECENRVKDAFATLSSLFTNNETENLQIRLRLCDPLDVKNPQEVAHIMQAMIQQIADYIPKQGLIGIQKFCRDVNAIPSDPLQSLVNWLQHVDGIDRPDCVIGRYESLLRPLQQTNWTEFSPGRAAIVRVITFLHCTQRGGLKVSSPSAHNVFPTDWITADYKYQYCSDVIGERYDRTLLVREVANLILNLGGQHNLRVSHAIFSNAGLDPYRHHGIAKHDHHESATVVMPCK